MSNPYDRASKNEKASALLVVAILLVMVICLIKGCCNVVKDNFDMPIYQNTSNTLLLFKYLESE